jgi:hypothetical protein
LAFAFLGAVFFCFLLTGGVDPGSSESSSEPAVRFFVAVLVFEVAVFLGAAGFFGAVAFFAVGFFF